jgi:hypothetical protein
LFHKKIILSMNKYTIWLKIAAIFQLTNAAVHVISFFISPEPKNDTEKQIFTLMTTYQFDMGAGFHRSANDLTTALSACFSLLWLLAGLQNWYLLRKKIDAQVIKGVIRINLIVFGICFVLMAIFTFLLPIICTGLIIILLLFTLFMIPGKQ